MHENSPNPYSVSALQSPIAAQAGDLERQGFIRRTYAHLTAAILGLVGLEVALFTLVPAETMSNLTRRMMGGYSWLIVLGLFMVVGWVARAWAQSSASRSIQYLGLSLYVLAEAVILLPLLYICIEVMGDATLPIKAAVVTIACFVGLTVFVFVTGVDLSGWGKFLALGGLIAMGIIIAGIFFQGFTLGLWFSGAMVALAAGYILYDTSNVMRHYHTDQYVAASLALFASVALMFWYVLQIFMSFGDD